MTESASSRTAIGLTAGQAGDASQAQPLIEGLSANILMDDATYDSDALRSAIGAKAAQAVSRTPPSRAIKHPPNKPLYAERHVIECCFSKLKRFRRVAMRYEKTARNYFAIVTIAAAPIWLR
ncbi:hypothetical protein EAS61_41565 [Bradyrhizobium zhanjiangense]|uniref:Transposase IS4-like domain-containing protein n=1 Tax=Bradyrhizobium zhanjiangense TaxID=1325107 RepID=A0A4Q0Q506_9BRAD|nr:hypothetical protein EAS61_41565 [Bradyrhizobium zhanjiangense]